MLSMKNISKVFKTDLVETHALRDFNLEVNEGEFVAVTGPSGSGKTTFLNIAGLLEGFTHGDYFLDGINVSNLSDNKSAAVRNEKIGFIFQGFNLIPDLNLAENIEVPLRYRGFSAKERKRRVEQALEQVGLASRLKHLPTQLSGGQQQRVAIARAFAINPGVLLLDEPFGALDALTKGSMQIELLKMWNLNNRDKTIIMITHDIEEAMFLSDRVVVLNNGPASTIREIVDIDLKRPRNKIEIVKTEKYIATYLPPNFFF